MADGHWPLIIIIMSQLMAVFFSLIFFFTHAQINLQRQFNSFNQIPQQCGPQQVCCRRPVRQPQFAQPGQCGKRNTNGITGRIKNPVYVDGDSEFGK